MSEEQEVVNEVVEQPTEVDSTTTETESTDTQDAQVSESADTDVVSKEVFLERLNREIDKRKGLEEKLNEVIARTTPQNPVQTYDVPDLDPDSTRAVQHLANQVVEQREVATFMAKHANELQADPLLDAAMRVEFEKATKKGGYVDREALLGQAKAALEARMKPAQAAAKQAGVEEGRDIAKTKQQLGAVGESTKTVEVSDDQLSPTEFAKKYNLTRQY